MGEPSGAAGLAPPCGEQDEQRVRGKSSRFGGEMRDVAVGPAGAAARFPAASERVRPPKWDVLIVSD